MKILIIQQKMIGDVLTSSLLFELLREKYPKAELHYLINSHTYPVIENNPFIDRVVLCTPEMEHSKLKFLNFLKTIREENYEVVVDVYSIISSTIISLFSKAKTKIAYHKSYNAPFISHPIKRLLTPKNNASLAIENRIKLLKPLDIEYEKDIFPKIYLNKNEIEAAKQFLKSHQINLEQPLFMISVLGSSDNKTYPNHSMALLIDKIISTHPKAQLLFNYMPKQKEAAKQIYDQTLDKTKKQIYFEVIANSLREFITLTSQCDVLIGNEGGANNIAKALNLPTFTIFSPFIGKKNWFGKNEEKKHTAVHLLDFLSYERAEAKKDPKKYYRLFKTEYVLPKLETFLKNLQL